MQDRLETFFQKYKIIPALENARSYVFDCPCCGGQKKLYIQKEDGRCVCFKGKSDKCPKAGSGPIYTLSLLSGVPFKKVKEEFFDFIEVLSDEIRVSFDEAIKPTREPLRAGTLPLDVLFINDPNAHEGREYLIRRGLTLDVLMKNSVLYSPVRRRVIFPVIMEQKLYGWQGRAIDPVDKAFRMENLEGDWKARTLMFYNNILNKEFAIIAEGAVSALKFASVGNYVATMGKEISREQLELLKMAGIKKLYIALDPDAVDKIEKIRQSMSSKEILCYMVNVPKEREDFGDCTYEECEQAFKNAELLDGSEIFATIEVNFKKII